MEVPRSRLGVALLPGIALLAVAIPVLAASPTPSASPSAAPPEASVAPATAVMSPSPSAEVSLAPVKPDVTAEPDVSAGPEGTAEPTEAAEPDEAANPDKTKPDKGAETAISLEGTVRTTVGGHGFPTYSMTVDGTTWTLSAGPPWYWGDKNPLAAYVGKSVTVAGTTRAGGTEVDVETVDGTALRGPGKPPWAGGPWVIGSTHPGWKDWMADGKPGNGHGRDTAPGQLKKASPAP
jgi:hypothetical protein